MGLYRVVELLNKNIKDDEDEAMFAKKGYKCASCEKNLVNFYGTSS